jgi:hypothetical protein
MTSGTASFGNSLFSLHDLSVQVADPSQLSTPMLRGDGRLEFDSTFSINYTAVISGGLQPPHTVSGIGTARAVGITRTSTTSFGDFAYVRPQVFDTELVALNLFGLSPIPEVMFRESPTFDSLGVTIRENQCPVCAIATPFWRISSYFDIFTEYTINGGVTWHPASRFVHIEQAPDGYPPGDYNRDKRVDANDYDVWRSTLGLAGAGLAADGDWSGHVDIGDFVVWKANVGNSAASFAVPEPTLIAAFCLAITAIIFRGRCY